ncbi:UNVERIFIED_CONTAM: hypothetical protein K2H54_042547 [Gekko kuhli]
MNESPHLIPPGPPNLQKGRACEGRQAKPEWRRPLGSWRAPGHRAGVSRGRRGGGGVPDYDCRISGRNGAEGKWISISAVSLASA